MSKWLSVCIFLLLAIACTVDVEPAVPVEIGASSEPAAIGAAGAPVAPAPLTWDEPASAAGLDAEGAPRALATRGFRHASRP